MKYSGTRGSATQTPPRKILLPGEDKSPAQIAQEMKQPGFKPRELLLPDGGSIPLNVDIGALSGGKPTTGVSQVQLKNNSLRDPKVYLAQIEVKAGMPEHNVNLMVKEIKAAKKAGCDMVVFPEMCVGGYLQGDAWLDDGNCVDMMRYNDVIKRMSDGIAVVWGNICLDSKSDMAKRGLKGDHPEHGKDRDRRYNAIYVAQDGKWAKRAYEHPYLPPGVQAKTHLPNYDMFDDERYFTSLKAVADDFGVETEMLQTPFMLEVDGKPRPIGIINCEDMWVENYKKDGTYYNPTRYLVDNGAERVIDISSSPWKPGKEDARDGAVKILAKDLGDDMVPFYYCAHTGEMNNGKNFIPFDGGSKVYNRNGDAIAAATEMFKPAAIVVREVDKKALDIPKKPIVEQKVAALLRGIKHLKDSSKFQKHPRWVIGLSGGIDSALSMALLHLAMKGEENVQDIIAVNMPTKYNSEKTKGAAQKLAEKLDVLAKADGDPGVQYVVQPIQDQVDLEYKKLQDIVVDGKQTELSGLDKQNIQAKIRGIFLSNLSSKHKGVFVSNGNKLEVALGYGTLYGDWGGAMNILGDLTKAEVYEIADYLNKEVFGEEVIPSELIPDELYRFDDAGIKPSAELEEEMVDPIKIGYHCAMLDVAITEKRSAEDMLRWWQDGTLHTNLGISVELMERYGMQDPKNFVEDLQWFCSTVDNAKFKRVQAPPIIAVTSSAYGFIHRESLMPARDTDQGKRMQRDIIKADMPYQPADAADAS